MKRYTIAIEETAVKEYKVWANDSKEAIKITEKKYKNCEFILDPGEVQFKQMCILKPENEMTEWLEF